MPNIKIKTLGESVLSSQGKIQKPNWEQMTYDAKSGNVKTGYYEAVFLSFITCSMKR